MGLAPRQGQRRFAGPGSEIQDSITGTRIQRLQEGLAHRRDLRQKEIEFLGDLIPVRLIVLGAHAVLLVT